MYRIRTTKKYGRGLYASKDIKKGDVISECELLILSKNDTKNVNKTKLKYYTFKYDKTRDCLVLGDGELFNHSKKANISYEIINGKMIFRALKNIKRFCQLFIDYNADIDVNFKNYLNKNLL